MGWGAFIDRELSLSSRAMDAKNCVKKDKVPRLGYILYPTFFLWSQGPNKTTLSRSEENIYYLVTEAWEQNLSKIYYHDLSGLRCNIYCPLKKIGTYHEIFKQTCPNHPSKPPDTQCLHTNMVPLTWANLISKVSRCFGISWLSGLLSHTAVIWLTFSVI